MQSLLHPHLNSHRSGVHDGLLGSNPCAHLLHMPKIPSNVSFLVDRQNYGAGIVFYSLFLLGAI